MQIIVDPEDAVVLREYNWRVSKQRNGYYAWTKIEGKTAGLHRLLMNAPEGLVVDHVNGNGLDNRRVNLRICTRAENSRGQHSRRGKSQYKGVYLHKQTGRWASNIRFQRKLHYLGIFDSEREAALAYDCAARELHGDYATLNLPDTASG